MIKRLFFENVGIRQTLFKNTFWLAVAEAITSLLGLILTVYIARILGATEYGKFAFALSFVSVFVILADLGLSDITTRELSREKEGEKEYPAILSLKIFLCTGVLILMLIGSLFITSDPIIQKAIWILAVFILISSFFAIIYSFLRARQKMEYEAGVKIFQCLMITGIGFFVLFHLPSVENLSYGYLFANLIVLIFVLLLFHFRIQSLKLNWNKTVWKRFLRISWPLSLGLVLGWIYVSIDSIMLGCFGRVTETGWYNAASKIVIATIIPATLISRSFYPMLSKFFKESKEKFQQVWNYQMELMITLALPVMAGGLVLAPKIINFFYGTEFVPSIPAFQLLIFVAGISFLYYPYGLALVVSNHQKRNFGLILIGAVINIILNLILIPVHSLYGAAIATIITSIIIFFLAVKFSKRFTPISPLNLRLLKILIITIFSSLMMFIGIRQSLIYNLNTILTIIIGILIYSFILFFFYKFSLLSK